MTIEYLPDESHGRQQLAHGRLSTIEATALSFALIAPVMAVALSSTFAATYGGQTAPLAYVLAAIATLCLAFVVMHFSRSIPSSGLAYTYVTKTLGGIPGFLSGWTYSLAWAAGTIVTSALSGIFLSSFVSNIWGANVQWYVFFVLELALVLSLAVLDVRISARFQLLATIIGASVLFIFMLAIIVKGGDAGNTLAPLNPGNAPSIHNLGLAMIYGFVAFVGFEGAAALGEETANPRRAIPRAIFGAVIVSSVFFIVIAYAMTVGFGTNHISKWTGSSAPVNDLMLRYFGKGPATVIDLMIGYDALAASLGNINLASRIMYKMSYSGVLPPQFARLQSKYRTPWVALSFIVALDFVVGTIFGIKAGPGTMIGFVALANTLGIILIYLMMALSGLVAFRLTIRRVLLIIPAIAVILSAFGFYESLNPPPAPPNNWAPYVVIAWIVIGGLVVLWLRSSKPKTLSSIGSLLEPTPDLLEPVSDHPVPQPTPAAATPGPQPQGQ